LLARGMILGLFFQGVKIGVGDEVLGASGAGGQCEIGTDHLLALALGSKLVIDTIEIGPERLQLLATGATTERSLKFSKDEVDGVGDILVGFLGLVE